MELWIRSQDKTQLLLVDSFKIEEFYSDEVNKKAESVYHSYLSHPPAFLRGLGGSILYINETELYASSERQKILEKSLKSASIISNNIILGTYKSKKRAIEILDEIQGLFTQTIINMVLHRDAECKMSDTKIAMAELSLVSEEPEIITPIVFEMPQE